METLLLLFMLFGRRCISRIFLLRHEALIVGLLQLYSELSRHFLIQVLVVRRKITTSTKYILRVCEHEETTRCQVRTVWWTWQDFIPALLGKCNGAVTCMNRDNVLKQTQLTMCFHQFL